MFWGFFGLVSDSLAIDLGTTNTRIYIRGRGIVLDEPSVVAVGEHEQTRQILAVGEKAARMIGRTPVNIRAVRPMRAGVIGDFEIAQEMIRHFIRRANKRSDLARPRIIITAPSSSTAVERRAIREAAEAAGARQVFVIEEAMAAAIGAGLPVTSPTGSMVVDIGGGTTDAAVLSLGGIVCTQSVDVGGQVMDEAIMGHVRRVYNLLVGEASAEMVKIAIGSAIPPPSGDGATMEISGRDLASGVPQRITVTEQEIARCLMEPVATIVGTVKNVLEQVKPELAADIVDSGIILTGGAAQLRGIDQVLRDATGLPVFVAQDPLTCGVRGAGQALEEMRTLKTVIQS